MLGRRNAALLLLLSAICFVEAAIGTAVAFFLRDALDAATSGDPNVFMRALLAFAGIVASQVAIVTAYRFVCGRAKVSVENTLKGWTFAKILGQTTRQSSEYHSGDLMTRMTSDVRVITEGATLFFPNLVYYLARGVGAMVALFVLVPRLAPIFVVVGCVLGFISLKCRGFLKRMSAKIQEMEASLRSFLQDCLGNLLVIRSFGAEATMVAENERNMSAYRKARVRREDVTNVGATVLGLVFQGGYVLAFAWCGFGILEGTVSYGTLVAVIQVVGQLQGPFSSIGGMFQQYSAMMASADRLIDMDNSLEKRAEQGDVQACSFPNDPHELYERMDKIDVENVTFGYGAEKVLSRFSCEIAKGEFATVLGVSGVGKSTLMKLLLGAYSPDEGRIVLRLRGGEEVPVGFVPAGFFAYVPQGNCLMTGTVREAVAFAEKDQEADEARMLQACKAACALEFIELLPLGFDTPLGECGSGLSEGQKQRLAVARAIYSGAPVLLLDEATSALDAATERRMLESIKDLGDRTVVVITHRPEALRNCDTVLRMTSHNKEAS